MPSVSEAQRKAMFAAASGKSTLGIPKTVGEDFAAVDPGGKLPSFAAQSKAKLKRKALAGATPKLRGGV